MKNIVKIQAKDVGQMPKGPVDFTRNGKCIRCGGCCSVMLPISNLEAAKIRSYIQDHSIEPVLHGDENSIDMMCPFLDDSKSVPECRIYPVRPLICQAYTCHIHADAAAAKAMMNLLTSRYNKADPPVKRHVGLLFFKDKINNHAAHIAKAVHQMQMETEEEDV